MASTKTSAVSGSYFERRGASVPVVPKDASLPPKTGMTSYWVVSTKGYKILHKIIGHTLRGYIGRLWWHRHEEQPNGTNKRGKTDDGIWQPPAERDTAAPAICTGAHPRRQPRRRSGAELFGARVGEIASLAAGDRPACLALHDPAQSTCQRCAPRCARGRQCTGGGRCAGADGAVDAGRLAATARPRPRHDASPRGAAPSAAARRPGRHALRGGGGGAGRAGRHRPLAAIARSRHAASSHGHEDAGRARGDRNRRYGGACAPNPAAPRRSLDRAPGRGRQGGPLWGGQQPQRPERERVEHSGPGVAEPLTMEAHAGE